MKKTLFGLAVGIFSITLLGFFAFHVKSSLAAGLSLSFSPNPANQSVTVTGVSVADVLPQFCEVTNPGTVQCRRTADVANYGRTV